MSQTIPTAADVSEALASLGHSQLHRLAELSGVSFTTLWSIRSGERKNPGIETVRSFMQHVPEVQAAIEGAKS